MSVNSVNAVRMSPETSSDNYYQKAIIIAVLWSFIGTACFLEPPQKMTFALFILGVPVNFIAYLIGDWFRRFTTPAFFTADGAMNIFFKKIFWKIGPQTIALVIGSLICIGLYYGE